MSFNINNVTKYKKLTLRGKTIENNKEVFKIPLDKDLNNSQKSEQYQDQEESFFKNSKIIISSRSSFFERLKPHTPFKIISKEKKLKDNQTNTDPVNKMKVNNQNESHEKINCLTSNNRINLKKYTSTIDHKKNCQISSRVILHKNLEDKLIPLLVINPTLANNKHNKNHFSNLNTFGNKIRNILSSGHKYKQNNPKNKIFDISSTIKKQKKNKNILYLNKRNLSNKGFNKNNFLIGSYAHNNHYTKTHKNKNSSNLKIESNKKNLVSILDINNSNKKNSNNLDFEHIIQNNFFQENKNLTVKYSSRKNQIKNEYKKKFGINISFDEVKNQKYIENTKDKIILKRHNLNKKNIKFNPGKYSNPNKFVVVENDNSLQETFKMQTVSNFNNKYNLKFKTKYPKEKEKVEELFDLLKLHKNSEGAKRTDFLSFRVNLKKRNKNHNGKLYIENYTNQKNYCFENDKKENKMISIKTLNFIEK